MGNSRRPAVVVIVVALILGLCLTLLSAENRKAEPINSERPVYVEPMDPNAGPQAMHSDNPEFGGGPNYNSDTRLTPDPSLASHRPTAIFVMLLSSAMAIALFASLQFLEDRKLAYTPERGEESDDTDENVDAGEANASR